MSFSWHAWRVEDVEKRDTVWGFLIELRAGGVTDENTHFPSFLALFFELASYVMYLGSK